MSVDWVTFTAISVGIVAFLLQVLGIFDIIAFVSKWLELRTREKRIEDLEELDKIRTTNLDDIPNFVEVKVILLQHRLSDAAPKVDLQFTINNRSIFDLKLERFTYKPQLTGVPGAELEQKEGCSGLIIPLQSSNYFTTYFQIPEKIKDKLYEWRKKSEAGVHSSLTWSFGCTAKFIAPKEFQLSLTVMYHHEYYKI